MKIQQITFKFKNNLVSKNKAKIIKIKYKMIKIKIIYQLNLKNYHLMNNLINQIKNLIKLMITKI